MIDLNSNTMDLKKIETTTTLRTLPSGHVAHKLTEFAPGGWKAPTLEQTDLFQVKTDVFRPVTLPGEIKSRSSKQCVGFSSGFVYTVSNQSYLISSRHQHDPDLRIDDAMSSDLLFDDQLAQRAPGFECSFASGFDVNARSAMGKLCTDCRSSVAKTCSAVPGSCHASVMADCAGLVATSFLQNRSDRVHSFAGTPGPSRQSVCFNGCVRQKTWRMRRHHELCPLSCIDRSQRSKSQNERKEERSYHDQSKSRTDCRGVLAPRRKTLSWMDSRRNTMYADQSMPQWSHNPWRVAEYQPTGGGNSASGSGGPGTHPRRDDGIPNPPLLNDWTAQVQALAANPAWAQEQFAQWQLLHQQYQHLQYQQQLLVATSTTDPWQVLPEDDRSTVDRWSMDTGTDRIGV